MTNITRYSLLQQKLHWLVVALVGLQYVLQVPMRSAMANYRDQIPLSGVDFLVTTLHTWGGAAVGALMVYRLWLRIQTPVPVGGGNLKGLAMRIASGMHWCFYVLLFFMALTGTVNYYLEWERAATWHEWGEWLLLVLIVLHGLAALLHHFWKKDDVLRQMCGSRPPH